jgi:hypothetical protein
MTVYVFECDRGKGAKGLLFTGQMKRLGYWGYNYDPRKRGLTML